MGKNPRAYQKLFAELKRRRVFNTAAIYGGVAFVIFQAADFVVPALRLSDTVATAIVLVAVSGFPVVVFLAWFFDLTPDGMTRKRPPMNGELEAIVAQPISRRWPAGIAALAGIILFFGGIGWMMSREEPGLAIPPGGVGAIGSVGVMPFLNLMGDPEATHLSEGIGNEILEGLRRIPGLKVAGQTYASSIGNSEVDLVRVAEGLGVSSILDGSVGEAGDQIEVAVRLVSTQDGGEPWTGHYHLPKDNLLSSLDSIARDLARELGAEIPDGEDGVLVPSATMDFKAYCDYLLGRHLSLQGTPAALESAIEAYNRALLLDPDFGPAWSALAMAYVLLPESGGPPVPEIMPYAQKALDHALAPGTRMPEGFATSGFLNWFYLWEFQDGEVDFLRSITLDPFNPISRYWWARALTTQRRWEEAHEQVRIALDMDPLSPTAHLSLGMLLFCEGGEGAREALRRGLELAPEMHPVAFILGSLLAMEGDLEGAAIQFERFSALTGSDPNPFHAYLSALSDPAKTQEAVSALQGQTFFGPTQGAALLAHLGETEAALALLERAGQERSPYLLWANALPQFQPLRQDHRFQRILAWVGL
jgi:TolB-like protein